MITNKGRILLSVLMERDIVAGAYSLALHNASSLARYATQYTRLQELLCNEPRTDAMTRTEERLERCIRALVHSLNPAWSVKLEGDPRGYVVKLILPSGRYNTLGGQEEGFGIA
jgi:hypothetical protein